jgi:anti-sigma factor RsiW
MKCAWFQERLLLYLAGELQPTETARLLKHLEKCAPCTALAEELAETQEMVDAAVRTNVEAPESLDARVMGAVRGLPPRRPSWNTLLPRWGWPQRLVLASAALGLVIIGFAAGHWFAFRDRRAHPPMAMAGRPTLNLELLGRAHERAMTIPPVSQPLPRRIAQALTPQVQFRVAAADLPSEGARLIGGEAATVQGTPVACLRYDWKGERVSLFQVDGMKLAPPMLPQREINGHCYLVGRTHDMSYVLWCAGTTNFVLVARADPERLFRLARNASETLERI